MTFDNLTSISPIDGRYSAKTGPLKRIFSEYGLIKYRLLIEVRWLEAMSKNSQIPEVPEFSLKSKNVLSNTTALWRATTIMGNRCYVLDLHNFDTQ